MKQFKDKEVLITGAGSGIGRATALAFAARGARLWLSDINAEGNEQTAALARAQTLLQTTQRTAFDLETRSAALEEGHRLLLSENQEIAGRLTTAQIRRLEAEKLLLESRIAWHRERVQVSAGGGQL